MNKLAIIGAGNAGTTLAAYLKLLGQEVNLYDIAEIQLAPIIENDNSITITGNLPTTGAAKIDLVTMNVAEAIAGVELIICTTPADAHKFVARDLARHLISGQILALNPGRTGGVLEVQKVLKEQRCRADILVVEAQTLLYACRKEGPTVHVFGVKHEVLCAGLPDTAMPGFFKIIQPLFPQFVPAAGGIWRTSLDNIGMLFHPAPTLLNLGRMESGQAFDYYIDGFSPSIAFLVEKLDTERLKVAEAIGLKLPTAKEWLQKNYGAAGKNLYEALQNNASYHGIKAPLLASTEAKKNLRYVIEDVPTGLVPVSELGKKFGIETPTIDTIIGLANALFDIDFRANGRNLDQLGLRNLIPDQIRNIGGK